ncbi:class I SAM-dependent methyltransferase [Salirhabdus salicampi]|nr:class I SAM-dependent methyltransferase [Salirhabdus salicampi]
MVADLGAGNGYFTIPAAKMTKSNVLAVDIEPYMLELLEKRANKFQIKNIEYIESDLDKIQLDSKSVDKVIVSFVIHEVTSIENTLNEIRRILKPGGKALIIEWEAIETENGPPFHERIPSKELLKIVKQHGFEAKVLTLNEANYGIVLQV